MVGATPFTALIVGCVPLASLARGLLGPRLYFSALAYISRRGRERLRVYGYRMILLGNFKLVKEFVVGLLELSEGNGIFGEFGGEGEDRFHE